MANDPILIIAAITTTLIVIMTLRSALHRRRLTEHPLTDLETLKAVGTLDPSALSASVVELLRSPDRKVRLSAKGVGLIISLVIFSAMSVFTAYGCVQRLLLDARFSQDSRTTSAIVTAASTVHARHGRINHQIRYQFQIEGAHYSGSASDVAQSIAHVSDQFQVRYLTSDPATNRPADAKDLSPLLALLAFLMVALAPVFISRQILRDYQLARRGTLARALIVGITNSRRQTRLISYHFLDEAGVARRGVSVLNRSYLTEETKVGSPVHVLYLTAQPDRNALYLSLCWQVID